MTFEEALVAVERMNKARKEKEERQQSCEHDWKPKFEWVYDYQHYTCTKCKKEMMS